MVVGEFRLLRGTNASQSCTKRVTKDFQVGILPGLQSHLLFVVHNLAHEFRPGCLLVGSLCAACAREQDSGARMP